MSYEKKIVTDSDGATGTEWSDGTVSFVTYDAKEFNDEAIGKGDLVEVWSGADDSYMGVGKVMSVRPSHLWVMFSSKSENWPMVYPNQDQVVVRQKATLEP